MIISSVDLQKNTGLRPIRRQLHQYPELSGEEFQTSAAVAAFLRQCHPDLLEEGLGGTGVAALFAGPADGPAILFRAELDALPILEINSFDHRSQREGVAHKCGHDGHTTILLGVARALAEKRPSRGRIILLFQPAEETGEGARAVLADPRFDRFRPDMAFALHNLPGYPEGMVLYRDGVFTAAVKSVIIRLYGKTSHAAEPEHGINPAPAIADILGLARELEVPRTERKDFALLTAVHLTLGEKAYGVSAGYGEVHLTLRTWTRQHMEDLTARLLASLDGIAGSYGLTLETEWLQVFEGCFNHHQAGAIVQEAAKNCGLAFREMESPLKWGEDFGAFIQRYSGALFGLGAGKRTPALHSPDYDFPDALLDTGVQLFLSIAAIALTAKSNY